MQAGFVHLSMLSLLFAKSAEQYHIVPCWTGYFLFATVYNAVSTSASAFPSTTTTKAQTWPMDSRVSFFVLPKRSFNESVSNFRTLKEKRHLSPWISMIPINKSLRGRLRMASGLASRQTDAAPKISGTPHKHAISWRHANARQPSGA